MLDALGFFCDKGVPGAIVSTAGARAKAGEVDSGINARGQDNSSADVESGVVFNSVVNDMASVAIVTASVSTDNVDNSSSSLRNGTTVDTRRACWTSCKVHPIVGIWLGSRTRPYTSKWLGPPANNSMFRPLRASTRFGSKTL